MSFKNKEKQKEYSKKYYRTYYRIPENKTKNKERMKLNYWRKKLCNILISENLDFYMYDINSMTLKELQERCKNE